jgi:hypothetical protein
MKRHYYISDDLDDLEHVEEELEAAGLTTPQIHVLSHDDAAVAHHPHLNPVEAVLKKNVVYGTEMGAVVGVIGAVLVLVVAQISGWTANVTWVPFLFLSVVVLGFCTWQGGLIGIQEPHQDFKRFQDVLTTGKHVFFVDVDESQETVLSRVVGDHPRLEIAGEGAATPGFVVKGQERFHAIADTLP